MPSILIRGQLLRGKGLGLPGQELAQRYLAVNLLQFDRSPLNPKILKEDSYNMPARKSMNTSKRERKSYQKAAAEVTAAKVRNRRPF